MIRGDQNKSHQGRQGKDWKKEGTEGRENERLWNLDINYSPRFFWSVMFARVACIFAQAKQGDARRVKRSERKVKYKIYKSIFQY